jgi:hypothetical protein
LPTRLAVSDIRVKHTLGGKSKEKAGLIFCFVFSFCFIRYITAGSSVGGKIPDISKPLIICAAVKPLLKIS